MANNIAAVDSTLRFTTALAGMQIKPLPDRGLTVVGFAGGGGSSIGIEEATGRAPDIAINHDREAMAMHEVNHPNTLHLSKNIWKVDPIDYLKGRSVALAWFSPDCKDFSKAKGGKPVAQNIRDLAWIVVSWMKRVRPEVVFFENVEEFLEWGPLLPSGKRCPRRKGKTFDKWVNDIQRQGYTVEWKVLRACDFGAPTIRKRLYLIARRDGVPITWPKPTHVPNLKPYRTAAEIIDWSLPCHSIFMTKQEARDQGLKIKRPLAFNTMRRIAQGIMKYVINAKEPFIVTANHQGQYFRGQGLNEPFKTLTAARDAHGLIMPFVSLGQHGGSNRPISNPLNTVTASPKDQNTIVVPTLIKTGYGERPGQSPRVPGLEKPIGTIVAGGGKHALVSAFIAQHNTGLIGRAASEPLSTITQRGTQQPIIASHMINLKGSTRRASPSGEPAQTVTAGGNHIGEIRAFLTKYYGKSHAQGLNDQIHTVTGKDTFGLVTVDIGGEPYAIVDIGMRMLTPRELFRAQGFPDSYIIDRGPDGRKLNKTAQVRMCGNSVCPDVAKALVSANLPASLKVSERMSA